MKIRRATIEDLPIIQKLNTGLFHDQSSSGDKYLDDSWPYAKDGAKFFTDSITKDDHLALVTEKDNKVIGYLTGAPNKITAWRPIKTSELTTFFILPEYRSKGVGAEMVKEFVKWSKAQGAVTARVSAYVANERGINFYKKVGFEPESLELEMELEDV